MNVVTYYRVSTQRRGDSGLDLEAHRSTVSRYLSTINAMVLDEFSDVKSGAKNDRPELQHVLRRCLLSGATLVIAKLDRSSRDVDFLDGLEKSQIPFVCADMPEANSLTITLLAALAQHERTLVSTRTKDALRCGALTRFQNRGSPLTRT